MADDKDKDVFDQAAEQGGDVFDQAARTQSVAPGTFQTKKGGPTYNANDLGTKEIEYPTMSAGISGSMARRNLPDFPQQVKDATTESVKRIPTVIGAASAPGLIGEVGSASAAGKLLPFAKRAATTLVGGAAGGAGGKYLGRYLGGDIGGAIGETVGGLSGGLAGGGAFGEDARQIGNPRKLPFVGRMLPDLLEEPVPEWETPTPSRDEIYNERAEELMRRGKEQDALDRAAARAARPTVGSAAQEAGSYPPVTRVPIRPTPPYKLTPESVPGPDTAGKGNLLSPLAKQGDPRAAAELLRRGRKVIYVPAESYPAPRSTKVIATP
jgi:hypothetical protein